MNWWTGDVYKDWHKLNLDWNQHFLNLKIVLANQWKSPAIVNWYKNFYVFWVDFLLLLVGAIFWEFFVDFLLLLEGAVFWEF